MEDLHYLWKAFVAFLALAGAFLLGKRTLSSTRAEIRLVEAKKERAQARSRKADHDAERAKDLAQAARLRKRAEKLAARATTFESTETDLRALLRDNHGVDDAEYARRFNARR